MQSDAAADAGADALYAHATQGAAAKWICNGDACDESHAGVQVDNMKGADNMGGTPEGEDMDTREARPMRY